MTDCEMTSEDYDTLVEAGYAGARAMTVHNNHRLANALFDAFKSWTTLERQAPDLEPHLSYAFDGAEDDPPLGSWRRRHSAALREIERITKSLTHSDGHDVHASVTLRAYSIAKKALDGQPEEETLLS